MSAKHLDVPWGSPPRPPYSWRSRPRLLVPSYLHYPLGHDPPSAIVVTTHSTGPCRVSPSFRRGSIRCGCRVQQRHQISSASTSSDGQSLIKHTDLRYWRRRMSVTCSTTPRLRGAVAAASSIVGHRPRSPSDNFRRYLGRRQFVSGEAGRRLAATSAPWHRLLRLRAPRS